MKYRVNDECSIDVYTMNKGDWYFWVDCYRNGLWERAFAVCAQSEICNPEWNNKLGNKRVSLDNQKAIETLVSRLWKMRSFL
jgi:hypothetical protein